MKKAMNPRLMLIASMTVFGTLGIFVRHIPVSSGELALYRAVLAAALLGGYFLVTKQKIVLKGLGLYQGCQDRRGRGGKVYEAGVDGAVCTLPVYLL